MSKKGIWLAQEMTPDQIRTIQLIAPEYELVEGFKEATELPLDDIEIVYGWDKRNVNLMLESTSSHLRWLQVQSAGVDYLNLARMKDKNILLTNGSGIHAIPIAESVFGMILTYTRGIHQAMKDQSIKQWGERQQIIVLQDCTIMIVGTGSIGSQVARLAKAFGMKTIGVNLVVK